MEKVPLRSSTELFEFEDDAGGIGTSGGVSYNIVVERVVLLPRVVTGKLRLKKEWRMPPKESQDLGICTAQTAPSDGSRAPIFFFAIFGRVCRIYSRPRSRRVPHLAPAAPDSVIWTAAS